MAVIVLTEGGGGSRKRPHRAGGGQSPLQSDARCISVLGLLLSGRLGLAGLVPDEGVGPVGPGFVL